MFAFETFTAALRVDIKIPVEVRTFGGISLVASALNQVETQRRASKLPEPKFAFDGRRGYQLRSFEVHSPPEVSAVADPAWLAVYLALITLGVNCLQLVGSYPTVKQGAKELARDIGRLRTGAGNLTSEALSALRTLSEAQSRELLVGAMMYLESASETAEDEEALILRATRFASILRSRGRTPELHARIEPTMGVDG